VAKATVFFTDLYHQYSYLLEDSNVQQVITSAGGNLSSWALSIASSAPSAAVAIGTGTVSAIIVFLVSLIVGYWVLKDLPKISKELLVIAGPRRSADLSFIAGAFSKAFGGYLRGMLVAGFCTGLMAGIGYAIIGLPYPALLGLLTGLMNFIPYFGPWIAGAIVAILGLFISPWAALLSIIITVLAQMLTDNLITPRVMSSTVHLHPAIVLVGVFAGGALAGIPGMIMAVPLLAAVKTIFVYFFEKRTGRQLADEDGALFQAKSYRMIKRFRAGSNSKGVTSDDLKPMHQMNISRKLGNDDSGNLDDREGNLKLTPVEQRRRAEEARRSPKEIIRTWSSDGKTKQRGSAREGDANKGVLEGSHPEDMGHVANDCCPDDQKKDPEA
jgi:predicted PurR-regulated permease PerM